VRPHKVTNKVSVIFVLLAGHLNKIVTFTTVIVVYIELTNFCNKFMRDVSDNNWEYIKPFLENCSFHCCSLRFLVAPYVMTLRYVFIIT